MVHYSCDICGQKIDERRFTARIEVFYPFDQDGSEGIPDFDADLDHLDEVSEILSEFDTTGDLDLEPNRSHSFRFDMCCDCQRQYVKDPLALHKPRRMRISDN